MYKIKDIPNLIKFMSKHYGIICLYIVIFDYSIQLHVTIIQSEPFKTKVYKSPCPLTDISVFCSKVADLNILI